MSFIEAEGGVHRDRSSTLRKQRRPRRGRSKPQRRFPPEVLTDREIAALIDVCKEDTPAGLRNRALIAILYIAGLRITEALALRPIDLDPRNGAIRILHAKGGRSRTVGMDALGFEILERWLQARSSRPPGISTISRRGMWCGR
jgi:site-specific recombinase XerD